LDIEKSIESIKKDLDEIKAEISFIKKLFLDEEQGLEVSEEVMNEIEESRKKKGKDLISHFEVNKKFCS